ncbi:sosondowah ankyrin repeat domain family Cb [Denticeps clupeoides]|uniref:SOWAHA-C winged helix-turn-helix domain-containing protein n=1 Tax=Denticeps clupeoides TaxID=299321 RepID=A0AAY4AZK6_9TELE|nr:ankyrin repeat domain-containing protein SOWAHC-like [Denticeps clupeoides]
MATECSQQAVLRYITDRGGRVTNVDLVEHFRPFLSAERNTRAQAREAFKTYVDGVAFVRVESGLKYVCLKKKFRVAGEGGAAQITAEAEPEIPPASGCETGGERRAQADTGADCALSGSPSDMGNVAVIEASPELRLDGDLPPAEVPPEDANTPRGSRKTFVELMMNSSALLSARNKDSRSDGESLSSSGAAALDPVEHEWMMCAADGQWESLRRLLARDPGLVLKRDFVTGFTCLHWAAKLGRQELLVLLVTFATRRGVAVDVNARSAAGYTPLHLAAMHGHVEVVKLLVGAYDADVEARDYSGKKACQYLPVGAAEAVVDIAGGRCGSDAGGAAGGDGGRWRINLKPLKLLGHGEEDACDGALRRKTSLSKMKPRLNKIRFRTQIVHSVSFSEPELGGRAAPKSPLRSRPVSNLFG